MAMIEVQHLQKNFVKTVKEPGLKGALRSFIHPEKQTFEAVKDLTFEVPKGQILGFIGANGAGKSTTIKMLTGILKPTSGFCRINGKIPQDNRQDYVKDIGVVFGQRTQLWWDLALQETYTVLKEIYDVPDSLFHKRMDFLNEVLDLKDFIKDPVRTLSLGQRMRADIAASLLHNPKVLFLDEPTIGLDVSVKDNIRRAITQINQEEETTILLTTHDLSDIEQLCDRIFMKMFHFYHCHKSLPSARNSNIVFLTTNILNPYFLHLLHFITTEGFIPTYYSPIKTRMQAFA